MQRNTRTQRAIVGAFAAAAMLGAATIPAHAQDELIVVEPVRATLYLNGGIGKDEEAYMRKIAPDWPLRMTFSERKDNEFVADVDVLIVDAKGSPYLMLSNAGPMTYAMLPPGKYRITARFKGQSETREVTLDGKSGRDVSFHWQGTPK